MSDRPCQHCLGVQHGHRFTCPLCGRGLVYELPTLAEIRLGCEVIRRGWSKATLRKQERYEEACVTLAHKVHDGMRRRDKEDGRET